MTLSERTMDSFRENLGEDFSSRSQKFLLLDSILQVFTGTALSISTYAAFVPMAWLWHQLAGSEWVLVSGRSYPDLVTLVDLLVHGETVSGVL